MSYFQGQCNNDSLGVVLEQCFGESGEIMRGKTSPGSETSREQHIENVGVT